LLTERWKPSDNFVKPAGLKYTASICVDASRTNILAQAALWLVLVTKPPAKAKLIASRHKKTDNNLFIINYVLGFILG
jgi:hypothetical protein